MQVNFSQAVNATYASRKALAAAKFEAKKASNKAKHTKLKTEAAFEQHAKLLSFSKDLEAVFNDKLANEPEVEVILTQKDNIVLFEKHFGKAAKAKRQPKILPSFDHTHWVQVIADVTMNEDGSDIQVYTETKCIDTALLAFLAVQVKHQEQVMAKVDRMVTHIAIAMLSDLEIKRLDKIAYQQMVALEKKLAKLNMPKGNSNRKAGIHLKPRATHQVNGYKGVIKTLKKITEKNLIQFNWIEKPKEIVTTEWFFEETGDYNIVVDGDYYTIIDDSTDMNILFVEEIQ